MHIDKGNIHTKVRRLSQIGAKKIMFPNVSDEHTNGHFELYSGFTSNRCTEIALL